MEQNFDTIQKVSSQGYELDFGDVFNNSFEIFKKIALNAGVAFLLISIIVGSIAVGIIGLGYGFAEFSQSMTNFNPATLSVTGVLIYLAAIVLITTIIAPFNAGIIKMAFLASKNEPFSVGTAFEYYKASQLKDLILSAIIISFTSTAINLLIEFSGIPVLGGIIGYIISLLTVLTIPLIIFANLSAFQALNQSILLVAKKPFLIFGLIFVSAMLSVFGIIGFCIGIFFTLPLIYTTHYAIYESIFGKETSSELDEIGTLIE